MNPISSFTPTSLLHYAQAAPAAPAPKAIEAAPARDSYQPTGLAKGFDAAAGALARGTCRVGGALASLSGGALAAQGLMHLAGAAPVVLTGAAAGMGLVGVVAVGGALAYAGWKAGSWAADKVVSLSDRLGETVGQKTGSQTLANVARIAPKLAVGLGLAATSSVSVGGASYNLAMPAALVVGVDGLRRADSV